MSTNDLHDHDLEGQLRSVLAERADRITGLPPDLAEVPLVVAIGAAAPTAGAGARRTVRWIAAAAVVGVAGLVAINAIAADEPDVRTANEPVATTAPPASGTSTTTPTSDPSAGMVDPVAPELPAFVQLDVVSPIYSAEGGPESVAQGYLATRFGDGVAEVEAQVAGDLAFTEAASPGPGITALDYDQDGDGLEELPKGTVFLRQDEGAWSVVAAVTDGLSLASVEREGGRIRGSAVGDASDPNLASNVSATTTSLGEAPALVSPGSPELDAEAGDDSVLVSAWSAGGRTLAITEFVSDPAARAKVVWAGSAEDRAERGDPQSTARAWAASIAAPLPVASAQVVAPLERPTDAAVALTLEGGLVVTLDLARTTGGWVVVSLQDSTDLAAAGSAATDGSSPDAPVTSLHLGVPDSLVRADLTTWVGEVASTMAIEGDAVDAGPDDAHVEQPGMNYVLAELDPPADVDRSLLVGYDAAGTVVTVQAAGWS